MTITHEALEAAIESAMTTGDRDALARAAEAATLNLGSHALIALRSRVRYHQQATAEAINTWDRAVARAIEQAERSRRRPTAQRKYDRALSARLKRSSMLRATPTLTTAQRADATRLLREAAELAEQAAGIIAGRIHYPQMYDPALIAMRLRDLAEDVEGGKKLGRPAR